MTDKISRPTPEPVARQLRQEAAFGCCRCGHPIVQYHHIIPYAADHHFRPQDMMALCPNCHDAANNGAVTIDEQRKLKSRPYNIKRKYATGFLSINGKNLQIKIGSNIFIGGGTLIKADEESLVKLTLSEQGNIELTLQLYDQQNNLIALINKNEWVSGDPSPWDIKASYQKLKIRNKKGQITLNLNIIQGIISMEAQFWWKGHLMLASPSKLCIDKNELRTDFINCVFYTSNLSFKTIPELGLEIGRNA